MVGLRRCRGSSGCLDATELKAQRANCWEVYKERNVEVSPISTCPFCTVEGVSGSDKNISTILHSLKKQLEVLREEVDQLIGEVDMGLELVGSKVTESPLQAVIAGSKVIEWSALV